MVVLMVCAMHAILWVDRSNTCSLNGDLSSLSLISVALMSLGLESFVENKDSGLCSWMDNRMDR